MYEIFWILVIGIFGIAWNLFAVVGFVVTVHWFFTKVLKPSPKTASQPQATAANIKRKKQSNAPPEKEISLVGDNKKSHNNEDTKPIAQSSPKIPPQKKQDAKPPRTALDTSTALLYTGAFLVAFAIFIFVAFNWQNYTDGMKTTIILLILTSMYSLSYLFSLKSAYHKVSSTFLMLASLALAFTGVGLWKFLLEGSEMLTIEDFWFIYSILLTAIYMITFTETRRKIYFGFTVVAAYMVLLFSAPALITEAFSFYRMPFILLMQIPLYLGIRKFSEIYNPKAVFSEIMGQGINLLYGISFLFFAYSVLFKLENTLEAVILTLSLFLPTMFVFIAKKSSALNPQVMLEGLLLPIKLLIAWRLIALLPSSYSFLTLSLLTFGIAYLVSFTNLFKTKLVNEFVIPVLVTSGLLALIYAWVKPVHLLSLNLLVVSGTYLLISLALHYKFIKKSWNWFRLINIPLDFIIFLTLIQGIDDRLDITIALPVVIGFTLLIPAVLYLMDWMLRTTKALRPELIGSMVFMTASTLFLVEEPSSLAVLSAIGILYYLVITIVSRKPGFIIGSYFYSVVVVASLANLYDWYASSTFTVLTFVLILIGSLWRISSLTSSDEIYAKITQYLQVIAKFMGVVILLLAFSSVAEAYHSVIYLFILLSILAMTVGKQKDSYQYLAGVGLVYTFWHLLQISDTPTYANAQLYAFPLVIYSPVLAYLLYNKDKAVSALFKIFSYFLPMSVALVQSISDPEPYSLYHGLLLITISTMLIIFGAYKKDKWMTYIATSFLSIELVIRLWDVIVSIPWWVYIGTLGMSLIGLSVWVIYKLSEKSTPSPTK